jgi:hypothetical protein
MLGKRTLKTDVELFAAAIHQRKVTVIQRDKKAGTEYIHEDGAIIEKFNADSVKVGGAYYFRQVCELLT